MISRKTLLTFAFATAAIASPFASQAAVDIDVNVAPPPPRHEAVPPPREGYVWTPGYWNYNGSQYEWIGGRFVEGHQGERWVPHRWEEHDGRYRLDVGHWDRDDHERREERDEHRRDRD